MICKTKLAVISSSCVISLMAGCNVALSKDTNIAGEKAFQQHCASCHTAGGNNLRPARPIAGSKHLVSIIAFKTYLGAPPGHMPYYQNIVNDKDLLQALYKYCKRLKKPLMKQAAISQRPNHAVVGKTPVSN